MRSQVLFGYTAKRLDERGRLVDPGGRPVYVTPSHAMFSGITGDGKTTAILGLLGRLDARALAFEVKATPKRKEPDYLGKGTQVPVYLKGLVEEITLKELLEDIFHGGMKREFGLLIQVCEGARSLDQVHANLKDRMAATKRKDGDKWEKMLTLEKVLGKLMAEIQAAAPGDTLDIDSDLNILDLRTLSEHFQQLVVQSCAEHIREHETDTIMVVDEAHRFVPESRPAASKPGLISLCKEGRSAGNWVWMASQAITSLNKQALKQVELWVIGRQREKLEVQRALDQMPLPEEQKPEKEEIMTMPKGFFWLCQEDLATKVYALPSWLSADAGKFWAMIGKPAPYLSPEVPWSCTHE